MQVDIVGLNQQIVFVFIAILIFLLFSSELLGMFHNVG